MWQVASYISIPFFGTYQISELGFSLKFVSLLTIISSFVRILASFFLGAYADKKSFAAMLRICFFVMCIGFLFTAFATPQNGKIMFIGHYICYGFALGGINSALINLIYDYIPVEKRADSLAFSQAVSGLLGFLATLAVSALVSYIQNNGNSIFGINIYAQQVMSILSLLITICVLLYVSKILANKNS